MKKRAVKKTRAKTVRKTTKKPVKKKISKKTIKKSPIKKKTLVKKNLAKKKPASKKTSAKKIAAKRTISKRKTISAKKPIQKNKKLITNKSRSKASDNLKKKKFEKKEVSKKSEGIKISTKKVVSNKKITRIPTNIKNFDKLIEGGFKARSTNLLVGGSGAGKTIFATQFLVEGMKKGEKCLYVTFEENKEEFYQNMMRFGWDLAEYERRGLFHFLIYAPIKVKTMLDEGGGAIESTILGQKISRMVIDSITSFALLFDDELEKREASLSLFNMISKWNVTSLLTYEGKPLDEEDTMSTRTMEFESDTIILFYYLRKKGERHRYLEILKMRGTEHSKKVFQFHVGKKGIEVLTKPVRLNT